jgi:DNA mismatch repair ATPase MutS
MMEGRQKGTFVVINELFTTAANYDAQMMGRKVLEHFIELGCMGIYVTHLKELASAHPQAVSLRATLDENKRPTYQIQRGEAAENAGAEKLVEKYCLTYRQLKERL